MINLKLFMIEYWLIILWNISLIKCIRHFQIMHYFYCFYLIKSPAFKFLRNFEWPVLNNLFNIFYFRLSLLYFLSPYYSNYLLVFHPLHCRLLTLYNYCLIIIIILSSLLYSLSSIPHHLFLHLSLLYCSMLSLYSPLIFLLLILLIFLLVIILIILAIILLLIFLPLLLPIILLSLLLIFLLLIVLLI